MFPSAPDIFRILKLKQVLAAARRSVCALNKLLGGSRAKGSTGLRPVRSRMALTAAAFFTLALTLPLSAQAPPLPDQPEDDIRPARPKVEIPVPQPVRLTPWVLAAAFLAGAGVVWWWMRRPRLAPVPPPLQAALTELGAIDRVRNQMEAAPLAEQAAGVVRRFLAARHGIAAPQRTTEEFLQSLTNGPAGVLTDQLPLLRAFLKSCDLAKFAGAQFDAAERLALMEAADRFVRAADHQPAPAPGPPPPPLPPASATPAPGAPLPPPPPPFPPSA